MKIILTGSTGFIGGEVLYQCLKNSSITSVIALSRRNLPDIVASNPKLKVVVLEDFMAYSNEVLQELAGAEACVWSLGGTARKFSSYEENHKVSVDYTLAAAEAFATFLAPQLDKRTKFRFVYLSGMMSERDTEKKFWYGQDTRKIKGEVENGLIECGTQHQDVIQTYIVKPGWVLAKGNGFFSNIMGLSISRCIRVDELATVMMDTALKGSNSQTIENDSLVSRNKDLLQTSM